jgi:hypothetical protein
MKPDKEGIYEWFEEDGTKRLVSVCNVAAKLGGVCLRVYWWGGYYRVNDEHDPDHPEHDVYNKAEWPDRWGNYVGTEDSIPDTQKYWMPTPEQRAAMENALQRHYDNQK